MQRQHQSDGRSEGEQASTYYFRRVGDNDTLYFLVEVDRKLRTEELS